ncbi:MAG: hypothetical protein HY392_04945 [Candidatus Diapherotrites archaeon]|nr:hypothetical protein [Candidatus Diapherotrites archaeon]
MTTARAYSPSHITGFFMTFPNGSTGAGISLEEGMATKVSVKQSTKTWIEIKINGEKTSAVTSGKVVQKYLRIAGKNHEIKVEHKTKIPIGYGLGASGAGALSLSIALNEALGTGLSKNEVLEISKQAEIEAGTGLGDVVAEQFPGILVGLPPFPSQRAQTIPSKKKYVVCGFFGPIKTKSVITNPAYKEAINSAGAYCMEKMLEKKTAERFVWLSRFFTLSSGMAAKEVTRVMDRIPGAAQSMLGNTVFTLTDTPQETKQRLAKYCNNILVTKIAHQGAHLL